MRTSMQVVLIGIGILSAGSANLAFAQAWERCNWAAGSTDRKAQCARVALPLDHGHPDRGAVEMTVKRRVGKHKARAQLWLVHGGPGSSAVAAIAELAFGLDALRPDIELYAVDHRGVGTADALRCRKTQDVARRTPSHFRAADWNACIAELKAGYETKLPHFTTTNSARDLGTLIERFRKPQLPVYVFGVSYGSHLLQRYLQLFPEQPTGVVLHGVANPLDSPIVGYEQSFNDIALKLLALCSQEPECRSRFNQRDPVEVGKALASRLSSGHCAAAGFDAVKWRALLATPLMRRPTQELFPALVFRLDRCSADDVSRFKHLARVIDSFEDNELAESPLLGMHIVLSEMFMGASDLASQQAAARGYLAAPGLEPTLASVAGLWPRYRADEHVGRWAEYNGPLLMFQGSLDPATNALKARGVGARFQGPHQHWVEFPHSAHVLMGDTPLANGDDCALRIYRQFLEDPRGALDTDCVSAVLPLNFKGADDISLYMLGACDAWGGSRSRKPCLK